MVWYLESVCFFCEFFGQKRIRGIVLSLVVIVSVDLGLNLLFMISLCGFCYVLSLLFILF